MLCATPINRKDKLPQCLVQITGTMRNLLGDTSGALGGTLKDVIGMLRTYHGSHAELSLNCLRYNRIFDNFWGKNTQQGVAERGTCGRDIEGRVL